MSESRLRVQDLCKTFDLFTRETRLQAIQDVSFEVASGEICALVGPSGAGKSTVLKCIHRTYLPSAGHIWFGPHPGAVDLATADDHDILELRGRCIGFVTQFLHCLPRKSALDVVAEPLLLTGTDRDESRSKAAELLGALNIPEKHWNLPPSTFSGGEQQRVNIARGFIRQNDLLLLDEPTASLDQQTAKRVLDLIVKAKENDTAIVAIWHDPAIVERLADKTVTIQPVVNEAVA